MEITGVEKADTMGIEKTERQQEGVLFFKKRQRRGHVVSAALNTTKEKQSPHRFRSVFLYQKIFIFFFHVGRAARRARTLFRPLWVLSICNRTPERSCSQHSFMFLPSSMEGSLSLYERTRGSHVFQERRGRALVLSRLQTYDLQRFPDRTLQNSLL